MSDFVPAIIMLLGGFVLGATIGYIVEWIKEH